MNDRTHPCVFDISNPECIFGHVYVDNLGLLSRNLRRSQEGLASLQYQFTHESSLEQDVQTTLGRVSPTCHPNPSRRWWWLYRGLCALLKRKAVTGAGVENISLCALLSLCAVVTSSRFFDNLQVCSVELSEHHTVRTFPLLWHRQWTSMVMSSNACMTGWGLPRAFWFCEVVSSVGHTSER